MGQSDRMKFQKLEVRPVLFCDCLGKTPEPRRENWLVKGRDLSGSQRPFRSMMGGRTDRAAKIFRSWR